MHPNVKKAFLQAMMNRGSLSVDLVIHKILQPICEAYNEVIPEDRVAFGEFVEEINKKLIDLHQALTFIEHPLVPNEEFLVYGRAAEFSISKLRPHCSDTDRIYFADLLERIVVKPDYGISWLDALSCEVPTPEELTKDRMQDLVTFWTAQGYFLRSGDSLYYGPRMLVEFEKYLYLNYKECVQNCPLCKKLVLWDVTCSSCDVRIHLKCIRTYLAIMSNCPVCLEAWKTPLNSTD